MPFHALFCFCMKGMKPASVKHMEYYFTDVCALQSANTTSREHKYSSIWNFPPLLGLHSPQIQLSCHFLDCYTLILSDKLFNFSFVSLRRDSLETNATRLIIDATVSVFKMLYPSFETAGAHSAISICTLQSC
jgi:hypothetical protein